MLKGLINGATGLVPMRFADAVLRLFGKTRTIIFVYHHVSPTDADWWDFIHLSHNVEPNVFRQQIEYLLN